MPTVKSKGLLSIKTQKRGEIHSNHSLCLWGTFRDLSFGDKFILKVPNSAPPKTSACQHP